MPPRSMRSRANGLLFPISISLHSSISLHFSISLQFAIIIIRVVADEDG